MSILIIAEAGINHDGSLDKAKRLVDAAKRAGADAVKFQFFSSRRLWGDDRIKHLELRPEDFTVLAAYCAERGTEFMSTPFGVEELTLITPLVKRIKIASGCIARLELLGAARLSGLPVILSTGMSTEEDIASALWVLGKATLLHCTSTYPCPISAVNLRAMDTLRTFGMPVGYSDHTAGITVALAAVARGAVVLEKHLTLDRRATGPDHKASIEPAEFRAMVQGIRLIEDALGSGAKAVQDCERELRAAWREH